MAWLWNVFQPSSLAWFLIFPRWSSLLVGLVLLAMGFVRSRWRITALLSLLWVSYTAFNVEESWSLARSMTRWGADNHRGAETIRVVSLNCGSDGFQAAAQEAFDEYPDLILFQESISREQLEYVASQYGKSHSSPTVIWGPDTSLVANGRLTLRKHGPRGNWVWATWHRDGGDIEVVSLRLSPVPVRLDCWNPDCWRALTQLRKTHEAELSELLAALGPTDDRRVIIGGDFNTPAQDASLKELRRSYQDSFDVAGVGWGNTIVNGLTVHRIDQVWISREFQPIKVRAQYSRYSDHALVISDLRLR